jgi:hypothetical protein
MQMRERLNLHLREAGIHTNRLKETLEVLNHYYPIDYDKSENLKDKLDVLAFRFAKLQDLIGNKIFREYLETIEFPTAGQSFLELLKELEKENIVGIDKWSEFRSVRNSIAHDYPYEENDKIEAINYLIVNIPYLINIIEKIEHEINK